MASTARASYLLEVAWGAYATGLFALGSSMLSGPDVLGVSVFDETFTGTYDNVSSRFRSARVERGRSDSLKRVLAGVATVDLRDPDGTFNPANLASPLADQLDERLHPVRLRSTLAGVENALFYGFADEIVWEPEGRRGVTRLVCVDLFHWLEQTNPVIAATGATTTGAAIGEVLDAAGVVDPMGRNLDVGDTIPDFSADGTKNALQLIEELLAAELGVFFINGAGVATYESRHSRALRANAATISDEMRHLKPGVDFKLVRNRVTVTRTQNGYAAVVEDGTSRNKIGPRDLPPIETPYLQTDSQADGLASYLLAKVARPRPPLTDFQIDHRTQALLEQALGRELVDVVTISEAQGNSTGSYHIEQLVHTIETRPHYRHSTRWLLSEAIDLHPIILGSSVLAATGATTGDVFVY